MRIFLAALFIFALAGRASAQDAKIRAVHGSVEILSEGAKKPVSARQGDTIIFGDTLTTKKDALVHLELAGGAVILLKGGTTFTLAGNTQDPVADIPLGEFLIGLAQKLKRGSSFRARTPAAVAAVRGTLFWGKTTEDKKAQFAAIGHSIEVTAYGKTVTLKPGQQVAVEFGHEPSPLGATGATRAFLQTFAVGGSLQGLEKLADKNFK